MLDAIAHRGPDASGVWAEGSVALGSVRLQVVDRSAASNQPMISNDGRYVIAYNGEVYNFRILAQRHGIQPRTCSDTEIIVELYARLGEQTFTEIEGMFALCIYDREQRISLLGRDPFGIKPLYISQRDNTLAYASEIKAILTLGGDQAEPDYKAVYDFLRWGALDHSEKTWFKAIKSVRPGHLVRITADGRQEHRCYSDLVAAVAAVEAEAPDPIERFRDLLEQSIRDQSVAARRVGTHLSGGIDSSIVSLLLAEQRDDAETYTFGYDEADYDERGKATAIAEAANIPNHASTLAVDEVERWYLPTLLSEDEPFTSFRQLSHHKLYADFAETGTTVILESSGGDEIAAGYSGFLWPAFLDQSRIQGVAQAKAELATNLSAIGIPPERQFDFAVGGAANQLHYGICTSDGTPFADPSFFTDGFSNDHGTDFPYYEKPFESAVQNAQYIEMFYTKLQRGLRYVDRASSAVGREARVPLLTKDIVALGLATPNENKIRDGQLRWFMKEAIRGMMPERIRTLNKKSVADPQRHWIRYDLAPLFECLFASKRFSDRGVFDPSRVKEQLTHYRTTGKGHSLGLYQVFATELWFRVFVDGDFEASDMHQMRLSQFIEDTNAK